MLPVLAACPAARACARRLVCCRVRAVRTQPVSRPRRAAYSLERLPTRTHNGVECAMYVRGRLCQELVWANDTYLEMTTHCGYTAVSKRIQKIGARYWRTRLSTCARRGRLLRSPLRGLRVMLGCIDA